MDKVKASRRIKNNLEDVEKNVSQTTDSDEIGK